MEFIIIGIKKYYMKFFLLILVLISTALCSKCGRNAEIKSRASSEITERHKDISIVPLRSFLPDGYYLLMLSNEILTFLALRNGCSPAKLARVCKLFNYLFSKHIDVDLKRLNDTGYLLPVIMRHFPDPVERNNRLIKITVKLESPEQKEFMANIIATCLTSPIGPRINPIDLFEVFHFEEGLQPFDKLDATTKSKTAQAELFLSFNPHLEAALGLNFPDKIKRDFHIIKYILAGMPKESQCEWVHFMFKIPYDRSDYDRLILLTLGKAPYDGLLPEQRDNIVQSQLFYIQIAWVKVISKNPELFPEVDGVLKILPFRQVLQICYQISLGIMYKGTMEPSILLRKISRLFKDDPLLMCIVEQSESGALTKDTSLTLIAKVYASMRQVKCKKALLFVLDSSKEMRTANYCLKELNRPHMLGIFSEFAYIRFLLSRSFMRRHEIQEIPHSVSGPWNHHIFKWYARRGKRLNDLNKESLILLARKKDHLIYSEIKKSTQMFKTLVILSGLDDEALDIYSEAFKLADCKTVLEVWLGVGCAKKLTKPQREELLKRMPPLQHGRNKIRPRIIQRISGRLKFLRILYTRLQDIRLRICMLSLLDKGEFKAFLEMMLNCKVSKDGHAKWAILSPFFQVPSKDDVKIRKNLRFFTAIETLNDFIRDKKYLSWFIGSLSFYPHILSVLYFLTDSTEILYALEMNNLLMSDVERYYSTIAIYEKCIQIRARYRMQYLKYFMSNRLFQPQFEVPHI